MENGNKLPRRSQMRRRLRRIHPLSRRDASGGKHHPNPRRAVGHRRLVAVVVEVAGKSPTLEELVDKSESLSYQSTAFMQQSKDMNSCCTLL